MKLKTIVIGVDFSEAAHAAAQWTARYFAPDGDVRLVHVLDIDHPPRFLAGRYPPRERLFEGLRPGVEKRLDALAATLISRGDASRRIETETRSGRPSDELVEAACGASADLIAIGEHGQRPGIWRILGSTAERLVRISPVPVLLARLMVRSKPSRILVPIDDSETATTALSWGLFLARRFGADITVLHVLSLTLLAHLHLVSPPTNNRVEHEVEESARTWIRGLLDQLGGSAEISIAYGEPRYEIFAAAKRLDAELIVVGSRGSGSVARTVLGSVTTAVLRGVSCPVLIVGGPESVVTSNASIASSA
jgi:nucleotide-binding universal stress UspA family protein